MGIPPWMGLAVGCLMGLLAYGPVERWIVSLRRAIRDQMQRPEAQHRHSRTLLVIFATLHPAPWLLLLGGPFFIYQLCFDPLRGMWLCVLAGIAAGVALLRWYGVRTAARARPPTAV